MDEQLIINALKHIEIINSELGDIKVNIAILQTQTAMLLKWFWLIASAVIGIVILQVAQLLQMKKNNHPK